MNSDFVTIRHPGLRLLLTLAFETAFPHGGGGGEGEGEGGGCAVVW